MSRRLVVLITLMATVVLGATPARATNGSGSGDCLGTSGGTQTFSAAWTVTAGKGLLRFSVDNGCAIYGLAEITTADDDIRIALAPGAVRSFGRLGLQHIGLYGIHATSIGCCGYHVSATYACFYPGVDFLILPDGHVVVDPCG